LSRRLAAAGLLAAAAALPAQAEPAIAQRTGLACSSCHVNRTGGGMRTPFASVWSQTTLPERALEFPGGASLLPADPAARFAFGADVRFQALATHDPESETKTDSFEVPEGNVFAEARVAPGLLSFYLDLEAGPGGASARELFAMLRLPGGTKWNSYLKAGKFLPAYGFRLPDDASYIRQFSGFTYSAPDIGVEAGMEPGAWSFHLSAINGSSSGSEDNRSKQYSFLGVRRMGGEGTKTSGRIGLSASNNILPGARVTQGGLLGGLSAGRLTFLGEADWRQTRQSGDETERLIGYFETDLMPSRGWLVKYVHDWTDPDTDIETDARARDSLGVEYIPIPWVQLRLFVRRSDGPPQVAGSRTRQVDFEAHFFF